MNHKGRIFFARLWKKDTLLNWNISHYRTEMKITFFNRYSQICEANGLGEDIFGRD